MFKRLIVEDWQSSMHIVAMTIFIAVFVFALLRVLCMPKSRLNRMSALPLENDQPQQTHERE